jgi:GTP diphosphokinase / guanosine-3',5'-bis(diphosphate) 3'-diphosphatase
MIATSCPLQDLPGSTTDVTDSSTDNFADLNWIPLWLKECLAAPKPESNSEARGAEANEEVKAEAKGQKGNDLISRAFKFAYKLHEGQHRASGEPYIIHPVEVATLLRELGGGSAMIAAGFLHDVVEDTVVTPEEIEAKFGAEVRNLVEAVTKLSKFNFDSKTEQQAENFRRMFLATARDVRVIVVKLADRLHNMRTLEHLSPTKQASISRETRDIFAPLAHRLGIGQFRWELEDLAFKYLEPEHYQRMESLVAETRTDREAQIAKVNDALRSHLIEMGLTNFEISGRPKHLYGIHHKMQRSAKEYEEIYDVSAVRVIVNSSDECYRVLAIVHNSFRPIPGRFKDYIALPKPNRYQSLHTVVIGPKGQPLEVQIRTWEMHHVAEYGIAAHWKYKETNSSTEAATSDDEKFTWLRQLVEWQRELQDDQEYIELLKDNFFEGEVYVFSPKGDVYCLPHGSTPIDFAYRVHTEVGNHACGALVNHHIVSLDRKLLNGDIVSILRHNNAHPNLDWINFVATNTAKHRIRQWYKRSRREENLHRGRGLLEKELGKNGLDALLKSDQMLKVAERCNYHTVDDLIAALGHGEISLNSVVNKLRDHPSTQAPNLRLPSQPSSPSSSHSPTPVSKAPILGVEGMLYHIAGCCKPLPGEPIIGIVRLGNHRGISIHRQDCQNTVHRDSDRLIPVSWNNAKDLDRPLTYVVDIQVETIDRVGVLKDILIRLSDNKVNVRKAAVKTDSGKAALIDLSIDITDRFQLEKICSQVSKMSDILSVRRVTNTD